MLYILLTVLLTLVPVNAWASALINLNTLGSETSENSTVIESEATVERVVVEKKQKGIFLALVPITFTVKTSADARGNVEVKYPWYSALTIDKEDEVKTKAKVAVTNALKASAVGSVRAAGESAHPRFTAREAKLVEAELNRVLDEVFAELDVD